MKVEYDYNKGLICLTGEQLDEIMNDCVCQGHKSGVDSRIEQEKRKSKANRPTITERPTAKVSIPANNKQMLEKLFNPMEKVCVAQKAHEEGYRKGWKEGFERRTDDKVEMDPKLHVDYSCYGYTLEGNLKHLGMHDGEMVAFARNPGQLADIGEKKIFCQITRIDNLEAKNATKK